MAFVKACIEKGVKVKWVLGEADHCEPREKYGYEWTCPGLAEQSDEEGGLDPLWMLDNNLAPKTYQTPCGAHCYCHLEEGDPIQISYVSKIQEKVLENIPVAGFVTAEQAAIGLGRQMYPVQEITTVELEEIKKMLSFLHSDIMRRVYRNLPIKFYIEESASNQAWSNVVPGTLLGLKGVKGKRNYGLIAIPKGVWNKASKDPLNGGWNIRHEYIHTTLINPSLVGSRKFERYLQALTEENILPTRHSVNTRYGVRPKPGDPAIDEDVVMGLDVYDHDIEQWAKNIVQASKNSPMSYGRADGKSYTIIQARKKAKFIKDIFLSTPIRVSRVSI